MLPMLSWFVLILAANAEERLQVLNFPSTDSLAQQALMRKWSDMLQAETGLAVNFMSTGDGGPKAALDRAKAMVNKGQADVLIIDVIDPGELEDYVDTIEDAGVSPETINSILPNTMAAALRADGKHTALPFANNFAMLFYRKDLLAKYNFSEPTPSGWTYDEMEHIARVVQAGERQMNPIFDGYLWQGAQYEGLTCSALEVIAGHDGGTILDQYGNVTTDRPGFKAALDRMLLWLYGDPPKEAISPAGNIISYRETTVMQRFCRDRNAMFARGWTSMIGQCNEAGLAGKYGVVRNSGVTRGSGRGTQGGAMIAIAKTSPRKAAAARFIDMVLSYESQLDWYRIFSRQSPRIDLATNTSLCSPTPQSCLVDAASLIDQSAWGHLPDSRAQVLLMLPGAPACNYSLEDQATVCDVDKTSYIVSRPSFVAGDRYADISQKFTEALHRLFIDRDGEALQLDLQCDLLKTVRRDHTVVPADHHCHNRTWAKDCHAGTEWQPQKFSCVLCKPGYSSSSSMPCQQCTPGKVATSAGEGTCRNCERGFVSLQHGATQCELCPVGKYSNSTVECVSCPPGKTSQRGSKTHQECECPAGTYAPSSISGEIRHALRADDSECTNCSEGLLCEGGTRPPMQEPAYWVDVQGTYASVFQCRSRSECPAGPLGSCAEKRTGIACAECVDGHVPGDGGCEPCSAWSGWPVIMAVVVAVLAGLALARLRMLAPGKVRLDLLTAVSAAGQVFVAVQALGSISALSIDWENPTKGVLAFCNFFSLDVDVFQVSCVAQRNSPVVRSATILLAYPVFFGIIAGICALCRRRKGQEVSTKDTLINLHGMMSCSLATVLSLRSADSFRCSENPNGKFTMTGQPGILCWETDTHKTLVAFSVVGLLCYPIMAMSWICSITFKYPMLVGRGRDAVVHHRHAFLFGRFRGRSFWFGLPYLARSLLIGLLPSVLAGEPSIQVMLVGAVFLASAVLQVRVWPWKAWLANVGDMLSCSSLVVLLLGAGPLVKTEGQDIGKVLRWMLVFPIGTIFIVGGGTICYSLVVMHKHRKQDLFLCHSKDSVGALCRLIKMTIAEHCPQANVYLDVDTSNSFVEVLDLVRYRTRHFVVVLTGPLLRCPWCVGQLATALERKLPVLLLVCDDVALPDASWLEGIPESWSTEQRHALFASGVTVKSSKDALLRLRDLTPSRLQRTATELKQVAVFLELASFAGFSSLLVNRDESFQSSDAPVVILTDDRDPEALASAHVLRRLLSVELDQQVAVAHEPEQLQGEGLEAVLVLFSRYALQSQNFRRLCRTLLKMVDSGQKLHCATLLAEPGLEPPGPAHCRALFPTNDSALASKEAVGQDAPALCRLFQALGDLQAQPFTAGAPVDVLKAQVAAVAQTHFQKGRLSPPFSVKPLACDFGAAHFPPELQKLDELQPLFYRAPEVFLGATRGRKIDMWSAGCTIYELVVGRIIFRSCNTNREILEHMMKLRGPLPQPLREQGRMSLAYFSSRGFHPEVGDPVDPDRVYKKVPMLGELAPHIDFGKVKAKVAQDLAKAQLSKLIGRTTVLSAATKKSGGPSEGERKLRALANLMERCMELDPNERISAKDACDHEAMQGVELPPHADLQEAPPLPEEEGPALPPKEPAK